MAEGNKKRFWKWGLVFVAVFFVFFDGQTASAAAVDCSSSSAKARCTITGSGSTAVAVTCLDTSKSDCDAWCKSQSGWDNTTSCVARDYTPGVGSTGTAGVTKTACTNVDDYGTIGNMFMNAMKGILYGVFKLLAWLLVAVVSLFAWMIDPKNAMFILGNSGLYASWAMVRDFLNLGFILVLIYIAFCVIFQISSYSDGWKKMLLMMVIMALLVNFSFPISRFIIDISNVTFYYLVDAGFGGKDGNEIMVKITEAAGIQTFADAKCVSVSFLLAMIMFTFVLMLTLAVIAVMFVIRLVALGILVIFSPIGFAGAAFPFSKKYATEWWDALFKYSFFAPIMMFMIVIAVNIFASLGGSSSMDIAVQKNMGANTGINPGFIGTMTFFSIPIVILWFGMAMAQKMGIAGATAVTGAAQSFAKKAGKMVYQAPWKGVKAGANATGIPGGVKQAWKKRITQPLDRKREDREAKVAGRFGDKTAAERNMRNRASQYEKDNMSNADLKKWATNGDAAAALALANKGEMDSKTLSATMPKLKDAGVQSALLAKTGETNMSATIQYKFDMNKARKDGDPDKKTWKNVDEASEDEFKKMTAEKWAKQINLAGQFKDNGAVKSGAGKAFQSMAPNAQADAFSRMNGGNSSAVTGVSGVSINPSSVGINNQGAPSPASNPQPNPLRRPQRPIPRP